MKAIVLSVERPIADRANKTENFERDLLGNRSHFDSRTPPDHYYTHSTANEYAEANSADPPVNAHTHDVVS